MPGPDSRAVASPQMVLLTQMIRTVAVTGRTDTLNASWFAGRQGGRWAEQTVGAAFPTAARAHSAAPAAATQPPSEPAETLRELTELHERGVITSAELEGLRARLRV